MPEGHVFGKLCKRDLYGAEDLMRDDCPPSLFKRDFHEWFDCINHLRNVLKRRSNSYFDLKYFQQKAASCDEVCFTSIRTTVHNSFIIKQDKKRLRHKSLQKVLQNLETKHNTT